MCVYGLIIVISLFGNFLVFSVILRTRRLHTITNLFIANLAFGDLLMTTFNIPFTVVRIKNAVGFGKYNMNARDVFFTVLYQSYCCNTFGLFR